MTAFAVVALIGIVLGGGLAVWAHRRDRRRYARRRDLMHGRTGESWPPLQRVQPRSALTSRRGR